MVLLIGNYLPDHQQSMLRVNAMMLQGLTAAGIPCELIRPEPVLGKFRAAGRFVAKWLGYIDKYVLFPVRLRKELDRSPELIHVLDHSNSVYVSDCKKAAPVLVTAHDMLAMRGAFGENTDCPASITGGLLQRWILSGLRRADALACISKATAQDAERLLARKSDKPTVEVVYLGLNYPFRKLDHEEACARLAKIAEIDVDLPFILHVGSNQPRKNREAVLRIFARCRQDWNGCLVFAGDLLTPKLLELARDLGIADRVAQFDNPSDEVLETLYNCALALVYPSRFEGFGWPVIEAQACGCPVICSNAGPLPEAAGDAGLFHDVTDEEGFAADILRLTDTAERENLSDKSLRNAAKFSTDKMISQYIDIYRWLGVKL